MAKMDNEQGSPNAGERHLALRNDRQNDGNNQSRGPSIWIILGVGWLLAGPRIPLFSIFGSSIRLEDLILASTAITVVRIWSANQGVRARATGISLIVLVSIASSLINVALGHVEIAPALLYSLRILEYWLIYPTLLALAWRDPAGTVRALTQLLVVVTILQTSAAAAQVILGVNFGFSKFSYERGAGLSAGPYELGALCAALSILWFAKRRYILFAIAVVGLMLSASRISLIALGFGLALIVTLRIRTFASRRAINSSDSYAEYKRSLTAVAVAAWLVAAGIATTSYWYPMLASASVDRIAETSLARTWETSGQIASGVDTQKTSSSYQALAYGGFIDLIGPSIEVSGDASNLVRFFRWHVLIDSTSDSSVIGVGPSFAGPSVDGAYLRVYVETGILGLATWFIFGRRLYKQSADWLKAALVTLAFGSIFIDLLFAMRPMVMIWTLCALAYAEHLQSPVPSNLPQIPSAASPQEN